MAKSIRNVMLGGHGGSGKTILAESLLYKAGIINRLGKIDDGTTVMDWEPEEHKHRISLSTGIATFDWSGCTITLLDTPGYADFLGEVKSALWGADAMVLVLSAVGGVEIQSEIVWEYADEYQTPGLIYINKMDRENADFESTLRACEESLGATCVAAQYPIGLAEDFKGIVDLIAMKAHVYDDSGYKEQEIPEELEGRVNELRGRLLDVIAENDDDLLEKYLGGEELPIVEIVQGLRRGIREKNIVPVFCGSATKQIGIDDLLTAIKDYLPDSNEMAPAQGINLKTQQPEPRERKPEAPMSALVFKTITDPFIGHLSIFKVFSGTITAESTAYDASLDVTEKVGHIFQLQGKKRIEVKALECGEIGAVAKLAKTATGDTLCDKNHPIEFPRIEFPSPNLTLTLEPKTKGDEEKLSTALARIHEEDPTFRASRDTQTHESVISGMGEMHIEVLTEKMKRKFGVEAVLGTPKIPYRETIKKKAKAEGKYKKQSGGKGQYGDCWLEVEPLPRGEGFKFEDKIFGGSIPQGFRPAVEKGIIEAMHEGVLSGNQVIDVKVVLVDGSYHSVDSSEMAFKIAGSMGFRNAVQQADPVLLEPVMLVEISCPENQVGDIMGDVNSKRGKVLGMEPDGGGKTNVKAYIPQAELTKYAIELRSISGGRAGFSQKLDHYEEVPAHLAEKIVASAKVSKEENQKGARG